MTNIIMAYRMVQRTVPIDFLIKCFNLKLEIEYGLSSTVKRSLHNNM